MIRKLVVALGIVAVFFVAYRSALRHAGTWVSGMRNKRYVEDATRSQTYPLAVGESIQFELRPNAQTLRLFANAALINNGEFDVSLSAPRVGSRFHIEYEIKDKSDRVLEKGEYHFRSRSKSYIHPETRELFHPSAFAESPYVPAATRTMQIPLDRFDGAAKLRVRLIEVDPTINDVSFRAYCSSVRPDYRNSTRWKQMTEKTKNKLTRACVYPEEMLSNEERLNMLRILWSPASPIGEEGRDYRARTLYQRNEVMGQEVKWCDSEAVNVDDIHVGTIQLPRQAPELRFKISTTTPGARPTPAKCELRWFGQQPFQRDTRIVTIQSEEMVVLDWRGGLVEVHADEPIAVVAEVIQASQPTGGNQSIEAPYVDITPERRSTRAYIVSGSNSVDAEPLEYRFSHIPGKPSPLRLTLRTVLDQEPTRHVPNTQHRISRVGWQYLDALGKIIDEGKLTVEPIVSRYDRIRLAPGYLRVTEPADFFFQVPNDIDRIRIVSIEGTVVANAFTRPADQIFHVRVPEDYGPSVHRDASGKAHTRLNRAWFGLRPSNYLHRIKTNQSVFVRLQKRPPEERPELLTGNYMFESFEPDGVWLGKYFFIPRHQQALSRERSLNATYTRVPVGESFETAFLSILGSEQSKPRIAYFGHDTGDAHSEVSIYVDGALHQQTTLKAAEGEIELLPIMKLGRPITLRFETTSPATFLLNQWQLTGGEKYVKRMAYELSEPLSMTVTKHTREKENLLIYVFQRPESDQRSIFRADLETTAKGNDGPRRFQSVPRRQFDVAPMIGPLAPGMAPPLPLQQELDAGSVCIIPLDRDLAPGDYRLTLTPQSDNQMFLCVCSVVPGADAIRQISFETLEPLDE